MRSPPEDSWNTAYGIFFLQGIGQLFPWNIFINAENYFSTRLCGSSFETNFENYFSAGYNLSAIMGLVLALRYQDRWNLAGRIMGSLAISLLAFVACAIFVLAEGVSSNFLFVCTMGLILTTGLSTAVLQGGLFSFASSFPPRYTQAMMAGQGLAGLAVALAGLLTTLVGPDDQSCIVDIEMASTAHDGSSSTTGHHSPGYAGARALHGTPQESSCVAYTRDWSTLGYFGVAVVVLLGCMLTYPLLDRLPLTAFYTRSRDDGGAGIQSVSEDCVRETSVVGEWLGVGRSTTISPSSPTGPSMYRRLVDAPPARLLSMDKPLSDAAVHDERERAESTGTKGYVQVETAAEVGGFRARLAPISRSAFSVFMVFTVTLSVFPGATSKIVSSRQCDPGRSRFFASDVFIMFSFVSFNAFDVIGRFAAGLPFAMPRAWLPIASVARLIFVPLFLLCRSEQSRFRNWLSADIYPLILMPMFALTNGYVGSLSMMAGSQEGAWAGTAMVLFLSGGLLVGSLLSFLVLYVSTES